MADSPLRIVLVDDDDMGRRMLRRALDRRGHEVTEANDGQSGIELVRKESPDIVLLDMRMPGGMSGLDVIRELRADDATSAIPVIFVTASVHAEVRDLATKVGAQGFVEKPVDFDELYAVLDRLTGTSSD